MDDLEAAAAFYVDVLGARVGRSDPRWVDFDFWGHQLTAHLVDGPGPGAPTNAVDHDNVPARHFGVILTWAEWETLAASLRTAKVPFLLGPRVRFQGEVGEQATLFVQDPAGNALEFKAFRDPTAVFSPGS